MTDPRATTAPASYAADRFAIADVIAQYGEAVDVLGNGPAEEGGPDPALEEATHRFSMLLTEDAQIRLMLDGFDGPSQPMGDGGAEGFALAVRAYFQAYGYLGTHHVAGNIRTRFEGPDRAVATSTIPCFHWLEGGKMLLAPVLYRDVLVRREDGWRIAQRDVVSVRFWVASGFDANPLDPTLATPAGHEAP